MILHSNLRSQEKFSNVSRGQEDEVQKIPQSKVNEYTLEQIPSMEHTNEDLTYTGVMDLNKQKMAIVEIRYPEGMKNYEKL